MNFDGRMLPLPFAIGTIQSLNLFLIHPNSSKGSKEAVIGFRTKNILTVYNGMFSSTNIGELAEHTMELPSSQQNRCHQWTNGKMPRANKARQPVPQDLCIYCFGSFITLYVKAE
jgi:hypothetical protein